MSYSTHGFVMPHHMQIALEDYVLKGKVPGGFLQAVICNDLKAAVEQADENNLKVLPIFVLYLYNRAPASCWGSREKMLAWMRAKARVNDFREQFPQIVDVWGSHNPP